jgi:hypothetical protein
MTPADHARNQALSERNRERCTKHGFSPRGQRMPEYMVWVGIKTRCYNKNDHNYQKYGARGIQMCERWRDSFPNFLEDMGRRPSDDHSIERIENSGNYEPGNCRWATVEEQANNRRSSRIIEFNGHRRTLAQWARSTGLSQDALYMRLHKGWAVERALTQPKRGAK